MISLRTSAQGNFHANTILPPLGHRREQFEVGNKISRFENRVIGNSRASVVSRLFIFLLFFLFIERSK